MANDSVDWSYTQHRNAEIQTDRLPSCYTAPCSVDAWRHHRMLEVVLPVLEEYPTASWLTIGDGRYGSDAFFLQSHGAIVTASSLTDVTLRLANEKGWIRQFRSENAEALTLEDSSVDFVLCKESFHHFPRPFIAFYEMMRVARVGVILIEPQETSYKLFDSVKQKIKQTIRGDQSYLFEAVGNYIFRVNLRELEKMQIALNTPLLVYKRFNDFFHPRLASAPNTKGSLGAILTRAGVMAQDLLCNLYLMDYGLITAFCLKQAVTDTLVSKLRYRGFRVIYLPTNPYSGS